MFSSPARVSGHLPQWPDFERIITEIAPLIQGQYRQNICPCFNIAEEIGNIIDCLLHIFYMGIK